MGKHFFLMTGLLVLIIAYLVAGVHFTRAGFQTIHVPADFSSIQMAIDNANPGATIFVDSGKYVEHLNINVGLFLIGEDRDSTIIDCDGADTAISITADDVTIQNFTVTKSGSQNYTTGISVNQALRVILDNLQVVNTYTGIDLASSTNDKITDCIVKNNTNGVVCLYANSNFFSRNTFSNNTQAIGLYYCGSDTFVVNTVIDNVQGLFLSSTSNKNNFYYNNFEDKVPVTSGSSNTWNHGNEGNYWAGYNFTGQDLNGDGIGAEPYRIDDTNLDYYPLMGVYSEYEVSFGDRTYSVVNISNSTISGLQFEIDGRTGNRILSFNATGQQGTTGFCRMTIPASLMSPPFTVTTSTGTLTATLLSSSNATSSDIYFSYSNDNLTVSVIFSATLQLYNELLNQYSKLQAEFADLNSTYQSLLANYTGSYQDLFNRYNALVGNLTQLRNDLLSMQSLLAQNLANQSQDEQNLRYLTYVFAALTAALLAITVYLSSRLYKGKRQETSRTMEEI